MTVSCNGVHALDWSSAEGDIKRHQTWFETAAAGTPYLCRSHGRQKR